MRQLIFSDKSGNIVGEFPHDILEGFKGGRRGLRRRLINANEVATLSPEQAFLLAQDRYTAEERRIREKAFVDNEAKRQADYRKRNLSFRDSVAQWLQHVAVVNSPTTVKRYSQTTELYLSAIGDHRLRDFSRQHNIDFFHALANTVAVNRGGRLISKATQNMHMRHLAVFLAWADNEGLLDKLIKLEKAQAPAKEMEVYSVEQLEKLKLWLVQNIKNAEEAPNSNQRLTNSAIVRARNLYRAYMLATNALLRSGAICALPLENIDLENKLIKIRDVPELNWQNKSNRWPNKPMNAQLYEFLKTDLAARGKNERWFLDNGEGRTWYVDFSDVSSAMTKACADAGLPSGVKPFHWGMRAAMITYLLNNGVSPQIVQQLADHSSIATTMKYFNTRASNQRAAVDLLPSF